MRMYAGSLAFLVFLVGCASNPPTVPLPVANYIDLPRFMGDWYVIANIPTFIEKDAFNAVESYRLDADGTIATTFTFNKASFDGARKKYTPRGFVIDPKTNAVWGMRFVWPVKADYRIVHIDAAYSETIVGRTARDYVWIMARTPTIANADFCRLRQQVADAGYDMSKLRQVPQGKPQDEIRCDK
jgi:apolipoprotein D and lipocalin family protein